MRKSVITAIVFLLVVSPMSITGCGGNGEEADERQIVAVERGDLVVTITADGNLDMPHQAKLRFGTPGTVKEVFVQEGDRVREGTLVAKLDDTVHKLAIAAAQYDVELAMNEIVEKIHPALMGYPKFYPDPSTVLYVEQAQEELNKAQELIAESNYQKAASEVRLAQHDLGAAYYMLNVPEIALASEYRDEMTGEVLNSYPNIPKAIELLEQDQERLDEIQTLIGLGSYGEASAKLSTAQDKLGETYRLVDSASGRIRMSQRIGECCGQLTTQGERTGATGLMPIPYPDTSTSLDWLRQVEEELQKIQNLMEQEDYAELELAEAIRMAQHEVEMSQTILENNELIFRSGLNLKASRQYSLNLQKAEDAVKKAKQELMKTEILAPFDGIVVDVGVKENDQLSSFDYSSVTAVHLVDTKTVKMEGVVDEIDIYQVEVGQEAIVTVDALPDVEVKGKVTFISPFGTEETGVVEFAVTISLEPAEVELRGGLTATADIIVEKHENVLLIPNRAVKGLVGDYWVEVVIDEATEEVEKRQVVLGAQDAKFTEVISGLEEGEKVMAEATRGGTRSFF
ncbi:MAG: efflux RND transporter periplasmic adaptor subunit [Dehalococcoidia bacterium]|nr:efflux RND transporter periplasmic adaptor subunit [Dehalococcoidia bacterium]